MANRHKGEVAFDAKGETFTLVLKTNALCSLQEDMATGFDPGGNRGFLLRLANIAKSIWDQRLVLYWALQEHHSDVVKSRQAAGEIIDEIGLERTQEVLVTALEWAFPPKDAPDPKAPTPAGTGAASS